MGQRFSPTINEDPLVGGSRSFGMSTFVPNISNLSGTHNAFGKLQRIGGILFFGIVLDGTSTTASSVLTLPITPYMRDFGSGLEIVQRGILYDTAIVAQNDNGTFTLADATTTTNQRRITGFYWVE